jgi:hypothetical protein
MLRRPAPGKSGKRRSRAMRSTTLLRRAFLVLLWLTAPTQAQPADAPALTAFAEQSGLRDVAGFVETVQSLRATGHLPARYATKREAAAHGWHGGGLCGVWPGHVIGGDTFDNIAGVLPGPAHVYREADIDESCRSRGPKRLLFSPGGPIYLTPDHYAHFVPVP